MASTWPWRSFQKGFPRFWPNGDAVTLILAGKSILAIGPYHLIFLFREINLQNLKKKKIGKNNGGRVERLGLGPGSGFIRCRFANAVITAIRRGVAATERERSRWQEQERLTVKLTTNRRCHVTRFRIWNWGWPRPKQLEMGASVTQQITGFCSTLPDKYYFPFFPI